MKKQVLTTVVIVLIVGAGAFYGGMKYQSKKTPSLGNFQNMTAEQRQQAFGQFRGGAGGPGAGGQTGAVRRGGVGGGFTAGEILSKDDKSVTVKLADGGTRIVFFSGTTAIGKTTEGAASDLEVGKQVTIMGTTNSDGSVTAQSIQLRPTAPQMPTQK